MEEEESAPPSCWSRWKSMGKVYAAHTLSTWGDNVWSFAGGLYMVKLSPGSLRLTAIYGLSLSTSMLLFGALLGKWIDRTSRIKAAHTCLVIQNLCVVLCGILLFLLLGVFNREDNGSSFHELCTIVSVIALSSVAKVASAGTVIILQKDWIVVICKENTDQLAETNSLLRTIELSTRLIAPPLVGLLFNVMNPAWPAVLIAIWNLGSVCLEYLLLDLIYRSYPDLAVKGGMVKKETDNQGSDQQLDAMLEEEVPAVEVADIDNKARSCFCGNNSPISCLFQGWATYFTQPVWAAGMGLALLYMTVLGLDNITLGYMMVQGVPESVLGLITAAAGLSGILGAWAYPRIRRRVGLERTGLFGFCFLISTSFLAVFSLFLPGSAFVETSNSDSWASVSTLILGVVVARFGLWIADLTVLQILQERVREDIRGNVNGVQESLNSSLDLLKCVLVIFLPMSEEFGYLVIMSFAAISTGWLLYALYSRQERGHICCHWCCCCRSKPPSQSSSPVPAPPSPSSEPIAS